MKRRFLNNSKDLLKKKLKASNFVGFLQNQNGVCFGKFKIKTVMEIQNC